MYQTQKNLTRTLRVAYPAWRGRIVLRTEVDDQPFAKQPVPAG